MVDRIMRRYMKRDYAESVTTYSGQGVYGIEPGWTGQRQFYGAGEPGRGRSKELRGHIRLLHKQAQSTLLVVTHFQGTDLFDGDVPRPRVATEFLATADSVLQPLQDHEAHDLLTQSWTDQGVQVDGANFPIKTKSTGRVWLGFIALGDRAIEMWGCNVPVGEVALSKVDDISPYFDYLTT